MASTKMCKPAPKTTRCGASQTVAANGVPCKALAPEKKHHFWHKNKNEQAIVDKHHGRGIRQCFGHGVGPGGLVHDEDEEIHITITRVEKKEERVSIVRVKNKKKC